MKLYAHKWDRFMMQISKQKVESNKTIDKKLHFRKIFLIFLALEIPK